MSTKKSVAALAGSVGCLGMCSVAVGHKALGISEIPRNSDQQATEIMLRWVDNIRKVAVPNATIQKYFPETYNRRIAAIVAANRPKTAQQMSNQEAVRRAHREIRVLR